MNFAEVDQHDDTHFVSCFSSHVTTATKVICSVFLLITIIATMQQYPNSVIFTIPLFLIFSAPFFGIYNLYPIMLLPLLTFLVFIITTTCMYYILMIGALINYDVIEAPFLPFQIFSFLSGQMVIEIWIFITVFRCYQYLQEKKIQNNNNRKFIEMIV